MLGTSDTWSMSLLSRRPSESAYYIVDWRIFSVLLLLNELAISTHSVWQKNGAVFSSPINLTTLSKADVSSLISFFNLFLETGTKGGGSMVSFGLKSESFGKTKTWFLPRLVSKSAIWPQWRFNYKWQDSPFPIPSKLPCSGGVAKISLARRPLKSFATTIVHTQSFVVNFFLYFVYRKVASRSTSRLVTCPWYKWQDSPFPIPSKLPCSGGLQKFRSRGVL